MLSNFFLLRVLGWCIPEISGVGLLTERSSFSLFSRSALIVFCFCSFCQLSLDLSAASCKFGFSANTVLNLFASISSCLFSKS